MDLTLIRERKDSTGIYSSIPELGLVTIEHGYPCDNYPCTHDCEEKGCNRYEAKIPNGKWKCKLGQHKLHSGPPFMTYEVTGVPNHTGLLFHPGNSEKDSEGCILLGCGRNGDYITDSRRAFHEFMEAQNGCEEFFLEVK